MATSALTISCIAEQPCVNKVLCTVPLNVTTKCKYEIHFDYFVLS